jgi:cytochrome c oxidase subunit IV
MSTVTEPHDADHGHEASGHDASGHDDHRPDSYYVKVALILAAITALEVALSYSDVGPVFLPALFIMMAIKFVMVVLIFMHLKFDSAWFNMAFWTGLGLAIVVYVAALSTFKFFVPS